MQFFVLSQIIFAHIDAFTQRLRDLLEICVCQKLFARRIEGDQEELPLYPGEYLFCSASSLMNAWSRNFVAFATFSGVKAPEITRVMEEVEKLFDGQLHKLHEYSHIVLDVKNAEWHEHMGAFRALAKDLEILVQNALFNAFEFISNIEQGTFKYSKMLPNCQYKVHVDSAWRLARGHNLCVLLSSHRSSSAEDFLQLLPEGDYNSSVRQAHRTALQNEIGRASCRERV